jgi:hypothetical protein
MEANHVHRRYGKDCQSGFRRFSLSAPSARENATISVGIKTLPGYGFYNNMGNGLAENLVNVVEWITDFIARSRN